MPTAPLAPLPLLRPGPGSRRSPAVPRRAGCSSVTLSALIEHLADLIDSDTPPPPHLVAEVVATLIRAAAAEVDALDLAPPGADAPAIVQHRALGRLASRTVGREIVLDVGTVTDLEAVLPAGRPPTRPADPGAPCSTSTWSPTVAVA